MIRTVLKKLALGIPPLRRLHRQRNDLLSEREAMVGQRDALAAEWAAWLAERAALVQRQDDLEAQRAALIEQRDALTAECASLARERDIGFPPGSDAWHLQHDSLAAKRALLIAHCEEGLAMLSELQGRTERDQRLVKSLVAGLRVLKLRIDILWGQARDKVYVASSTTDFSDHSLFGTQYEPPDPPVLGEPVIISTLPKSGTYVIRNSMVFALGYRQVSEHVICLPEVLENKIYAGHILRGAASARPELDRLKRIVFVRDPRGYVASYANFIRKVANGQYVWREMNQRFPTLRGLAEAIIHGYRSRDGGNELLSLRDSYQRFCFDWMTPCHLLVKYEDLFLPGTKDPDPEKFREIARYLGFDGEIEQKLMAGAAPEYSATFTPSPPDAWREVFDRETITFIQEASAFVADHLGYAYSPRLAGA